ncbi:NAD(P)H-dependent oxidoreductase [Aristaeella hokkaidonensis]|uniref:NAD(P)H-dependent oxidoreductase n=1 Tax=Aristaeella hokkaidonensis TaxID=3046382 RepID=A0AC61MUV2_9FIRM|nr:NAD(P)H-dependent oxidoreductase [Aristaeella hokkaidonensis]QUC65916.1 NAD(P)H-dependent oxidoreductase [Aristaeella hokkaidonensis]SNT93868.1 Putative NADPH-quinone reductase (modulator of drug activity B) [Aristaeella hokkaidonensis]
MKALIVYCHPSEDSFTRHVRDAFIKGITDGGNEYILSDLYAMDFRTDMSEKEYLRDANYRNTNDLAEDVLAEQDKINAADAIVLIYPVFWTEAPAKLVGWIDRVWSYGFAYGEKRMKTLDKALILCTAGNTMERLEKFGLLDSMKKVMFGDRFFNRIRKQEFVVFDGMTRELAQREQNWEQNLAEAYEKGRTLFDDREEPFSVDGRLFTAVENSESGEVSDQTIFCYHQKGNVIWAEYSGGSVVKGFLVGTMDEKQCLHFTYQHINTAGELKAGSCDSEPQEENGRLRFYEKWQWTTGEAGNSIIEEI